MKARVKETSIYPSIRSAGIIWTKTWAEVPEWAEREICANPYLETETAQVKVTEQSEPTTAEDKAVKLVEKQPGQRRGRRKL